MNVYAFHLLNWTVEAPNNSDQCDKFLEFSNFTILNQQEVKNAGIQINSPTSKFTDWEFYFVKLSKCTKNLIFLKNVTIYWCDVKQGALILLKNLNELKSF